MEKNTARLEAFSDGIFGVAITLLAIEIGIDNFKGATNISLWESIIEKWPEYFTYFNSFATVLLIWMGHNKIFKMIKEANHWLVLLNGLMLLLIVLFPFPTRMVGVFIGTPAAGTAVSFYALFTGSITLSMLLFNLGILNNSKSIINPEVNVPQLQTMVKAQFVGIGLYAIAAIVAFYSIEIALVITFLLWVFWAITAKD
jgi:uncharacterized membrane protein